MNNKTIWDRILGFAMLVAAAMLYTRTSEIMTAFAPKTVFGYTGLEPLFGNVSALLVEGVILGIHFIPSMKRNESAQFFKWVLFAISSASQVIDGFLVKETIGNQPEVIQFVVNWGVPLIPTIVFLGLLMIGAEAEKNEDGSTSRASVRDVGLKNMLPNFKEIWNGRGNGHNVAQTTSTPILEDDTETNFTKGKVSR